MFIVFYYDVYRECYWGFIGTVIMLVIMILIMRFIIFSQYCVFSQRTAGGGANAGLGRPLGQPGAAPTPAGGAPLAPTYSL